MFKPDSINQTKMKASVSSFFFVANLHAKKQNYLPNNLGDFSGKRILKFDMSIVPKQKRKYFRMFFFVQNKLKFHTILHSLISNSDNIRWT